MNETNEDQLFRKYRKYVQDVKSSVRLRLSRFVHGDDLPFWGGISGVPLEPSKPQLDYERLVFLTSTQPENPSASSEHGISWDYQDLLEQERRQTQFMDLQRAQSAALKVLEKLKEENSRLKAECNDLQHENLWLQRKNEILGDMTMPAAGCLCMQEIHYGTVEKVTATQVEATYWMMDGSLTQTYDRSQFRCIPEEGDRVKANVTITIQPAPEQGNAADIESQFERLSKLATTEPIRGS